LEKRMFVLPIKSTYVPHWGTFECLREILQNAKDEEEENGHKMTVKYKAGWLRISNLGADLTRKALLIGETSKSARADLRGQFGEGLDLALLSGVRAGYEIRVYTRTEVWTPTLEHVAKFDAEVLVVRTRALTTETSGVEVRVKMPLEDWREARKLFRFLVDDEDEFKVKVPKGTILLHPDRREHIYAKGIYCTTIKNLSYGYDLNEVKLDRDRRMVDIWDLRWELADMLRDGVDREPGKLGPSVYGMLKEKTEDVHAMGGYGTTDAFAAKMAEHFQAEHGVDAVPVESMAESQKLDHVGAKGVVVSDTLKKVLEKKVKSAADVHRELSTAAEREWSWHDLEEEERATLGELTTLVHEATTEWRGTFSVKPLLDRLRVVDFKKDIMMGTCDRKTGVVKIARRLLISPEDALITLVHEEAHALSAASDGAKQHIDMVERIWARLYFLRS
jgi:hypothetical protein